MKKSILVSLLALLMMGCQVSGGSSLKVEETTVEMRKNPEGVAVSAPRFSWQLVTDKQDVMQTAYQIEVADSEKGLQAGSGLVWNSGRVESGQSVLVKYAGASLESGQKYWWRVTVWTNTGDKAQSSIQYWSMALLDSSDWKAGWIGLNDSTNLKLDGERTILPARYLRKEFDLPSQPKRAVLYVSGVGSSVCYMNGERIGNDVFGPLPTWYDASVSYLTYDVTPLLKSGTNTIGVALGNGRYLSMRANGMVGFGLPRLMAQLNIEYDNGETVSVASDDSWKVTNCGPITANNEFDGEWYDARLELGKWAESGYDDSGWKPAERMEAPKGKLVAQLSPSLKVMEEIKPISVKSVGDGRYIVDMGQNMVGIQQVKLRGKTDKPITMRFAEVLKDNGTELYLDNLRSALVTDIYTPAADGEFVWEPLFVYHGFRFMEISGLDYEPAADDFIGKVVYDEMATNGTFETSEELINRIHKNAYWGIRGNYRGMPTDCPQREKNGWTGDGHFAIETALYNYDGITVYEKWLADHRDEQQPNGVLPDIIPTGGWGYGTDNGLDWTSTIAIIPWNIYMFYGDHKLLADCYENIRRYVDYVDRTSPTGLTSWGRGDWVPVKSHSSKELTSSVYFYVDTKILANAAKMFNKTEDYKYYSALANKIKNAINDKFLNRETGIYGSGVQTEQSVPLQWGIVPEELKRKVARNLAKQVEAAGFHLDVGVLGAKAILNALSENGEAETAYKLAAQDTYPSWGCWIANGATTLLENWDLNATRDISDNHMMFGEIGGWFYKGLGGIFPDPENPGFKHILLRPNFPSGLNEFEARYQSPYGEICSKWERKKNRIVYHVTVPANSTATFYAPDNVKGERAVNLEAGKHILELPIKRAVY